MVLRNQLATRQVDEEACWWRLKDDKTWVERTELLRNGIRFLLLANLYEDRLDYEAAIAEYRIAVRC